MYLLIFFEDMKNVFHSIFLQIIVLTYVLDTAREKNIFAQQDKKSF